MSEEQIVAPPITFCFEMRTAQWSEYRQASFLVPMSWQSEPCDFWRHEIMQRNGLLNPNNHIIARASLIIAEIVIKA